VLSDLGYTVLEADNSQSGLRIVETRARIDLLLTDVGLTGGMTGGSSGCIDVTTPKHKSVVAQSGQSTALNLRSTTAAAKKYRHSEHCRLTMPGGGSQGSALMALARK
jgi:hypothetical protein